MSTSVCVIGWPEALTFMGVYGEVDLLGLTAGARSAWVDPALAYFSKWVEPIPPAGFEGLIGLHPHPRSARSVTVVCSSVSCKFQFAFAWGWLRPSAFPHAHWPLDIYPSFWVIFTIRVWQRDNAFPYLWVFLKMHSHQFIFKYASFIRICLYCFFLSPCSDGRSPVF